MEFNQDFVTAYLTRDNNTDVSLIPTTLNELNKSRSLDYVKTCLDSIVEGGILATNGREHSPERLTALISLGDMAGYLFTQYVTQLGKTEASRLSKGYINELSNEYLLNEEGDWKWASKEERLRRDFDSKECNLRYKENRRREEKAKERVDEKFKSTEISSLVKSILYFSGKTNETENPEFREFVKSLGQRTLVGIYDVLKTFSLQTGLMELEEWELKKYDETLSAQTKELNCSFRPTRVSDAEGQVLVNEASDLLKGMQLKIKGQIGEIKKSETLERIISGIQDVDSKISNLISKVREVNDNLRFQSEIQMRMLGAQQKANGIALSNLKVQGMQLLALYAAGATRLFTGGDFQRAYHSLVSNPGRVLKQLM